MNQTFGDFHPEILANYQFFTMELFLHCLPKKYHRKTRYLYVAFISDYLANLFPVPENDHLALEKQLEVKSAATYITNELLENATKFSNIQANCSIQFGLGLCETNLIFTLTNCVAMNTAEKLQSFINELLTSDLDELYFRQLEKGAEENSNESGLGLLSMMNDYSAKLGWKMETVASESEIIFVTTMVHLPT